MAEPVSPNVLTEDQRARRQRIIDAGLALLERDEYERIQIKDVAEEADVALEKRELETTPEAELKELAGIYVKRGLTPELAHEVARQL